MTESIIPEWAKPPLLPFQSSDLERDLDIALSHIESVEIPIRTLWDPWKCPMVALPYLAWAVKVTNWDAGWTEKVKRQVVADSLDVHRVRGTRPAVEMALRSLGTDATITEWFEDPDGRLRPGTFEVDVKVREGASTAPNPDFINQLRDVVSEAKPLSRPFGLRISLGVQAVAGIAANLRLVQKLNLSMAADAGWTPPTGRLFTDIGIAASMRVTQTFEIKMETI